MTGLPPSLLTRALPTISNPASSPQRWPASPAGPGTVTTVATPGSRSTPCGPTASRRHHRATRPYDLQKVWPRGAAQPSESSPARGSAQKLRESRASRGPTRPPIRHPAESLLSSRAPASRTPQNQRSNKLQKARPRGAAQPPVRTPPSSAPGARGQQATGVAGGPRPNLTADWAPMQSSHCPASGGAITATTLSAVQPGRMDRDVTPAATQPRGPCPLSSPPMSTRTKPQPGFHTSGQSTPAAIVLPSQKTRRKPVLTG
ncbi:hypothetical protein NDU88_004938 [Pleurodeles waltl]|uniref:Uncharacterized protein n=1 Tax=Pleurodeles waltl TaxID=8319 RepID=A0AAV7LLE0_PLEWA|nr:hypothetical protein NDU88_004938 [Pleurodeles waltl]